jgi:hypothetical protein
MAAARLLVIRATWAAMGVHDLQAPGWPRRLQSNHRAGRCTHTRAADTSPDLPVWAQPDLNGDRKLDLTVCTGGHLAGHDRVERSTCTGPASRTGVGKLCPATCRRRLFEMLRGYVCTWLAAVRIGCKV